MVVTPFHGGTLAHAAVANPSAITSALVAELGLAEPDDAEIGACCTGDATRKALRGKGKTGIVLSTSTTRIFLETRPASRVFSFLHDYASRTGTTQSSRNARRSSRR